MTRLGARRAVHQVEQDALADAAIGDAQAADRPGRADRVEDGAAAQHQIGALAADAGVGGAALDVEPGEMARDDLDLVEGQHAAVDHRADIARQRQIDAGQRRHRARAAEHLHLAGADLAADAVQLLERRQRRLGLGDHRAVDRRRHLDAAEPLGEGHDAERQRHRAEDLQFGCAPAAPGQIWRSQTISVEPPPISNTTA